MLGMNVTSFLTLLIVSVVAAAVYHWILRYRFLEGIESFLAKVAVGWVRRYWDIGWGRFRASTWYRRFSARSQPFTSTCCAGRRLQSSSVLDSRSRQSNEVTPRTEDHSGANCGLPKEMVGKGYQLTR